MASLAQKDRQRIARLPVASSQLFVPVKLGCSGTPGKNARDFVRNYIAPSVQTLFLSDERTTKRVVIRRCESNY